jgi:hypothetical protein
MSYTNLKAAVLALLFPVILQFSCTIGIDDPEFCNPLDPAPGNCPSRLIDNFDDGRDPNLLGFNPKFFFQIADSANVFAEYVNERQHVLGGQGFAIRIDFDVSSRRNSFGGWIQPVGDKLQGGLDATNFNYLTFWAKADSSTINFEISLKDNALRETAPKPLLWEFDNLRLTRDWQKIRIPLSTLQQRPNAERLNLESIFEIVFAFSKDPFEAKGAIVRGTFYMDEIALEQ